MEVTSLLRKIIKSTDAYVKSLVLLLLKVCPECKLGLFKMSICVSKFTPEHPETTDLVMTVWSSILCRVGRGQAEPPEVATMTESAIAPTTHTHLSALFMHPGEWSTDVAHLWESRTRNAGQIWLWWRPISHICKCPEPENNSPLSNKIWWTFIQVGKIWWTFIKMKHNCRFTSSGAQTPGLCDPTSPTVCMATPLLVFSVLSAK